jgi:trimeric autotransporter adhesin
MKKYYTLLSLLLFVLSYHSFSQTVITGSRQNEVFLEKDLIPVASGLLDPWEIAYGPDDSLWITESKGYKVYKMSPNGGAKRTILDIGLKSTWLGTTPASDSVFNLQFVFSPSNPQGGLAGLAIHPDFNNVSTPKKYVYVSYIRSYISTAPSNAGVFYQNRLVRFTYNTVNGKLANPVSLCDTLPGSSDHNSQRIIIAPVNGVNYIFYAQGDMGAGQFGNQNRTNNAQNISSYEGKILRFNLEPDADAGTLDKWIPNDNPYNGAKQSAIWCMGIRNNQGFAYDSVRDILYGASHGPYSDDEINIIQPSKNYGHPLVIGYAADNNYNSSSAGAYPASGVPVIASETANAATIGASYKDPIFTGYSPSQATVNNIWVNQPSNSGWPSEAWSGIGLYNYSIIPDWKNSLIMSGLKWGRLIRTRLDANGTAVVPTNGTDTVCYFDSPNRFRDIAFGPGGKDIYVIMDKSAATSGPSANNPMLVACGGCVQKYTFLGYNASGGTSTIPNTVTIASGKPNICENANTVTINAASSNNNLWVPITDTSGNIVAEINANGNDLGNVTTSLYVNSGTVREQAGSYSLYLDRNITITPQTQPSTAVSIRIYLSNAEFTALKNAVNSQSQPSGVATVSNLSIYKNSDPCSPGVSSVAARITTTNQAAFGAGGYVLQANISSFSTFYVANVTALLPVHLLSFNGTVVNSIGQLKWVTENEVGTKSFSVERSTNGRDFYTIGSLQAAGNNTGKIAYAYPDSAITGLSSQTVYYRLRMIDADGAFSYSGVIILYLEKTRGSVNIHPNPVMNDVTLEINAVVAEKANCELTDVTGKIVLQQSVQLVKGDNTITIHLDKLPAGIYYLKVSGNSINQAVKLQKL